MHKIKFWIILLLFAVASYGQSNSHFTRLPKTTTPKPAVIGDPSATATNGSTLQDILKELSRSDTNQRSRRQLSTGCFFSSGTYGGGGGTAFNELLDHCGAQIKRITIRAALYVDGIQITYRLSDGTDRTASYHGGHGGTRYVINIDIHNNEKIVGVFGKSAGLVDQLGFVTNKGRIFGPYGGCGGRKFTVSSCHVRGMYGRAAGLLDSIGFVCGYI